MVTLLLGAALVDCRVVSSTDDLLMNSLTYSLVNSSLCPLIAVMLSVFVVMTTSDVTVSLLCDVRACSMLLVVVRCVSLTYTVLVESLI